MNLKLTRAIIDAIHDDVLAKVPTKSTPIFGLNIPESCPGVPKEILDPRNTWQDKVFVIKKKKMKVCEFIRTCMMSL